MFLIAQQAGAARPRLRLIEPLLSRSTHEPSPALRGFPRDEFVRPRRAHLGCYPYRCCRLSSNDHVHLRIAFTHSTLNPRGDRICDFRRPTVGRKTRYLTESGCEFDHPHRSGKTGLGVGMTSRIPQRSRAVPSTPPNLQRSGFLNHMRAHQRNR